MDYDAWAEGYERAVRCKANRYDPDISARSERVGNWIVSAQNFRWLQLCHLYLQCQYADGAL